MFDEQDRRMRLRVELEHRSVQVEHTPRPAAACPTFGGARGGPRAPAVTRLRAAPGAAGDRTPARPTHDGGRQGRVRADPIRASDTVPQVDTIRAQQLAAGASTTWPPWRPRRSKLESLAHELDSRASSLERRGAKRSSASAPPGSEQADATSSMTAALRRTSCSGMRPLPRTMMLMEGAAMKGCSSASSTSSFRVGLGALSPSREMSCLRATALLLVACLGVELERVQEGEVRVAGAHQGQLQRVDVDGVHLVLGDALVLEVLVLVEVQPGEAANGGEGVEHGDDAGGPAGTVVSPLSSVVKEDGAQATSARQAAQGGMSDAETMGGTVTGARRPVTGRT